MAFLAEHPDYEKQQEKRPVDAGLQLAEMGLPATSRGFDKHTRH